MTRFEQPQQSKQQACTDKTIQIRVELQQGQWMVEQTTE